MPRSIAPLSLDLDNKWSYLMTHGDRSWENYPTYLDLVVPRILDFLDARSLKITFFLVGRDAAMPRHHDILAEIVARGHQVGNHSFDHQPWLHTYTRADLDADFDLAESAIVEATGVRPLGFRGPGFSISDGVLQQLIARGYRYDATVFPNVLNPLSRAYYFWKSDLTKEERRQRKALFGTLRTATRPNKPYRWELGGSELVEVPVTTFPLLRVPIHVSYLTFLGHRSERAAAAYLQLALRAFRISRSVPSMLLHPLDFLGHDDEPELGFFPGMNMSGGRKLEMVGRFLDTLGKEYELVPLEEYVDGSSPAKLVATSDLV